MVEILPIKNLHDEDAQIFGNLNVLLGKLFHLKLSVARGVVVTPQDFRLKTVLEHYDFGSKEVFEQSLTLVKKELYKLPFPQNLVLELKKHNKFFLNGKVLTSTKEVWSQLIESWLEQIRKRLWNDGFSKGLTENLNPQKIVFINRFSAAGRAEFNKEEKDAILQISQGKVTAPNAHALEELIMQADKKLIVSYLYEWIVDDHKVFISDIKPYVPLVQPQTILPDEHVLTEPKKVVIRENSTVKVFVDLSASNSNSEDLNRNYEIDGVFLAGEKIIKPEITKEGLEDLILKLVDLANTFVDKPVLFKLPDFSEGMGQVRGSMRLIHQPNVLNSILESVVYSRFKHLRVQKEEKVHGYSNIHVVIPFVRGVSEFLEMKRSLAIKKLIRKNSLQIFLELSVPENIINLEEYVIGGLDGVVINLDEILSHLLGFDHTQQELHFYKKQTDSLLKFLEPGISLLHKNKVAFLVSGTLTLVPEIIEFLVFKGVKGIVVEGYELYSVHQLLGQVEKKVILKNLA
ncbi:hypothetical protein HYW42_05460 [Candidatus Daviesbacteria bacterium]|nr:hypothetical protein [Candidatus Daviesbacteria bacterium]